MAKANKKARHQQGVLRVLQTKEETKAFYNKIARVYDMLSEHSEAPVRRRGFEMLNCRLGEKVLEIGFGTGHVLVDLAEAVGQDGTVYGIDLSDEMVRTSDLLLEEHGLAERVELTCGDATDLPYASGLLDAVFMSFTLELFDTPEIPLVLAQCRRVLRQGGRIVVAGMSRLRPEGVMTQVFEWTHQHFPNLLDCRPILVREALEDAGFEIRDATVQMMWVPVELVLGRKP